MTQAPQRRGGSSSRAVRVAFAVIGALVAAGFVALGTWQIERRAWKLDLIDRVETRLHAPAVDAPGPDQWPQITAAGDEYRRVRLTGAFVPGRSTAVQAVTDIGSGFWVLTPMRVADGSVVLVNRGFVPSEAREAALRGACVPQGVSTLTGLLRISEPGGGFLRHNDPAADRWYSRDVQAISAARGEGGAAPYFVDQDDSPAVPASREQTNPAAPAGTAPICPVPGLTVVSFHNNHLVYAVTWYVLAMMAAAGAWLVGTGLDRRLRARDT